MKIPFNDRRPVEEPGLFAGRSEEIGQIVSLFGSGRPQSCNIISESRVGVTSILNYIQGSSGKTYFDKENYLFVKIDLGMIDYGVLQEDVKKFFFQFIFDRLHKTIESWLGGNKKPALLNKLKNDYDKNRLSSSNFLIMALIDYLSNFFEEYNRSVIVFIFDKSDRMLEYPDIGTILRSILSTITNLAYIVVSNRPVSEIKPDDGSLSALSNMLNPICIGLMKDADILEMLQKIIDRFNGRSLTQIEQNYILELSGGHPDFAKIITYHIYEHTDWETNKERTFSSIYDDLKPICENYWISNGSKKNEKDQLAESQEILFATTQGEDVSIRYGVKQLQEKGLLAIGKNGLLQIFSPIFSRYIINQVISLEKAQPLTVNRSGSRQQITFEVDRVIFGDEQLLLSIRELQIFKYLYENRDRPCSQKELYDNFWKNQEPFSKEKKPLVNITIQRLREKINAHSMKERVAILPHRGEGYQMIVRMI